MPKLIEYPRTTYSGAWELGEVIDDTGGKCSVETAAKKLNRKVSGSFKAIVGSGVKFGLLTSKRELLSTTTLFKRIKHAYDKQEEMLFHREAFLNPPLFTQLCRKFRGRELPVQMLDVMLIREFGVEEINAQGVARAFVEGARMVGLLDEHDTIADIDLLNAHQPPRRELASPQARLNTFRQNASDEPQPTDLTGTQPIPPQEANTSTPDVTRRIPAAMPAFNRADDRDAVANLFGFAATGIPADTVSLPGSPPIHLATSGTVVGKAGTIEKTIPQTLTTAPPLPPPLAIYKVQITGPGVDTTLSITDEDDLSLVEALLNKIRRQLRN